MGGPPGLHPQGWQDAPEGPLPWCEGSPQRLLRKAIAERGNCAQQSWGVKGDGVGDTRAADSTAATCQQGDVTAESRAAAEQERRGSPVARNLSRPQRASRLAAPSCRCCRRGQRAAVRGSVKAGVQHFIKKAMPELWGTQWRNLLSAFQRRGAWVGTPVGCAGGTCQIDAQGRGTSR